MIKSPIWAIKDKNIAKKKNLASRKFRLELNKYLISAELFIFFMIASIINNENKENIKDPKTPDKVFLGLILVIFFHLNIFPKE